MGDGTSKIVQTQAHADEEEAQFRKKGMSRNKTVSWGKIAGHERIRTSPNLSPDTGDLGERYIEVKGFDSDLGKDGPGMI